MESYVRDLGLPRAIADLIGRLLVPAREERTITLDEVDAVLAAPYDVRPPCIGAAEAETEDLATHAYRVLDYIRAHATPERDDRLFPTSPTAFGTNALSVAAGAAGVLARSDSARAVAAQNVGARPAAPPATPHPGARRGRGARARRAPGPHGHGSATRPTAASRPGPIHPLGSSMRARDRRWKLASTDAGLHRPYGARLATPYSRVATEASSAGEIRPFSRTARASVRQALNRPRRKSHAPFSFPSSATRLARQPSSRRRGISILANIRKRSSPADWAGSSSTIKRYEHVRMFETQQYQAAAMLLWQPLQERIDVRHEQHVRRLAQVRAPLRVQLLVQRTE